MIDYIFFFSVNKNLEEISQNIVLICVCVYRSVCVCVCVRVCECGAVTGCFAYILVTTFCRNSGRCQSSVILRPGAEEWLHKIRTDPSENWQEIVRKIATNWL